jgi:FMN phosphatase YigB (HAD superfamily)
MIRAVLFDLFETLVTEYPGPPTRASSLGPVLGLEREAYRVLWKARRPRIVVGTLSFRDALTEISTALTGSADAAAIQRICEQRVGEKVVVFRQVDADIAAMIGALRARGLRLAVISNGFAEDVRGWPTWPLAREFQCTLFSCESGIAKPDPQIYLNATRALGVESDAAIYIGDGGDSELQGAEDAGLRAFRADWFARNWPHTRTVSGGAALAHPQDVLNVASQVTRLGS